MHSAEKFLPPVVKVKNKRSLLLAEIVVKHWNALILPTETCYGIAADATNATAVRSVYCAKQRKQSKQVTIIVDSLEMAKKYLHLTPLAVKLSNQHHPGPLTIIVKRKRGSKLAKNLSRATVGFRITSNKFCLNLIKKCRVPLTATSANIAGQPAAFSIKSIPRELLGEVDLVIDAGMLPKRSPSTIVDCTGNSPLIVRQGSIHL